MFNLSVSTPRIDASFAKSGGREMHNYLNAVASAFANQELRQRLQLIVQAYDLLAAGSGSAVEQGLLPKPAVRQVFAGGRLYSFSPFRLFPSQRLLLNGNRTVQVGSRAFDILTILVERAGEVIGKDELIARVWPNVFVDDSNLKVQVSALRRALGEDRAGRCYIVTIPGRGYNFVAPVSVLDGPPLGAPEPKRPCSGNSLFGKTEQPKAVPVASPAEPTRVLDPCT